MRDAGIIAGGVGGIEGACLAMSVIAGVVSLHPDRRARLSTVEGMLRAMEPPLVHVVEAFPLPEGCGALGRVAYGPDENERSDACGSGKSRWALGVGELYNDEYAEGVTMADALVDRYNRLGWQDFARGLNGSFAAVVADPPRRTVTLVTDHTASCPLYSIAHDGLFYFASEIKALLAVPEIPNNVDPSAVLALLTTGWFLNQRTLVQNVERMDYATVCHVADGKITTQPWWRYEIQPSEDLGPVAMAERLKPLLFKAIERRLRTGAVTLALSGGSDSRAIAACLPQPPGMTAFTYTGRPAEARHPLSDWALAERTARLIGLDHVTIEYQASDFANALMDSVYYGEGAAGFVHGDIWQRVRTSIGADYILLGDECVGWAGGHVPADRVATWLRIFSLCDTVNVQGLLRGDRLNEFLTLSKADPEQALSRCHAAHPQDQVDELYLDQRLANYLNPKRRFSTFFGLFARNPWLDFDVIEFFRTTPGRYRLGKSLFVNTVREINPALFEIPRPREDERPDFKSAMRRAEQQDGVVSSLIFEDNPLLDDFFDRGALEHLIKTALAESPSPSQQARGLRRKLNPKLLLPLSLRLKLGALRTRFAPSLVARMPPAKQLNRVLTVAVALRMLHNRFKRP